MLSSALLLLKDCKCFTGLAEDYLNLGMGHGEERQTDRDLALTECMK